MRILIAFVAITIFVFVIVKVLSHIGYKKAQKKFSAEREKLEAETKEWLDTATQWWVVRLSEQNEGKDSSPVAAIKNTTVEELIEIFKDRQLGVMGYDLSANDFRLEPEPLIEEYQKACDLKIYDSVDSLKEALDKDELRYSNNYLSRPIENSIMMQEKYLKTKPSSKK